MESGSIKRVFGSESTTSFFGASQRANQQALKRVFNGGLVAGAEELAIKGVEVLRGVNTENAIKTMDNLLKTKK